MPNVAQYLARITSEHADKPNFVAFVTALVGPLIDAQNNFQQLLTTFDIDTAIGVQLDAVGQWVGRSRNVLSPISGVYFSLDEVGLGFDQGVWFGPFDVVDGLTQLDDETFRALLRAKIILNHWDGTIAMAATALKELFGNDPNVLITIQDNQDMSMTVGISGQIPGNILLALLEDGYVPFHPEGVGVNYVITSVNTAPLFGLDVENNAISGFDVGAWEGIAGAGPGQVNTFAVVSVTSTSATFSWLAPSTGVGPFTYQLQYQLGSGGNSWVLIGPPVTGTTETIVGLAPETTYTFEVYAVSSNGPGIASQPLTITTSAGLPGQVTGLQSTGSTANSITLAWNSVTGNAITYQVQFRPSGVGSFSNYNGSLSSTTVTVTGLTVATAYDFQVFAQNASGAGPASAVLTTGTSGAIPGVVQSLTVGTAGPTDIQLSWSQPTTANGPYSYTVQYAVNTNPVSYQTFTGTVTVSATGGSCDVTGLANSTAYLFRVAAVNAVGPGPYSTPVSGTTASGALAAPTNLETTGVTGTTVSLQWNAVSGAATYQVQYESVASSNTWVSFGSPTASLTATVTGLTAGTQYNFQVYAINSSGATGTPSSLISVTTTGAVAGQALSLSVTSTSQNSVSLSWAAPNSGTPPFVYQMQWQLSSSTVWNNFGSPISTLSETVTGLQSGQSYNFQVIASNTFGAGPASASVTATTTAATAVVNWSPSDHTTNIQLANSNLLAISTTPPLTAVSLSSDTSSSLTIQWTAPSGTSNHGVRGNVSQTTGKYYIEYTLTYAATGFAVGVANSTWNYSTTQLGFDANSLGFYAFATAQNAVINGNSVFTGNVAAGDTSGDTVSCAFDFGNKLFWITSQSMRAQYGASAWNDSSTANPATGAGGVSMSALAPGAYFPAFFDSAGSCGCTMNPSGGFVIPLPTGFAAWGGTASLLSPPGQVTGLAAGTALYNAIPLTWTAPASGGAPSSYYVQYQVQGGSSWLNGPITTSTAAVVTNLLPSYAYTFEVYAVNSAGAGPTSLTVSASTAAQPQPTLAYRGLNISGSDLTAINGLGTPFPNANALIIPVFCSTASQTSTDVTLTVTLTTVAAWISAANAAGFEVFLGVYVIPRDGSPMQTITPGSSLAGVATFMANLQSVCVQVAQLGQQNGALGMWTVELQPWAGAASGDTGPWNAIHTSQWLSLYQACKAVWPTGIISYAALQTTLNFSNPSGGFSVPWNMWDAVVIDIYPGSDNSYTTTTQFQNWFDNDPDPDPATVTSVGAEPLITALVAYSNLVGRGLIINQCGIIPADGNQTSPGQKNVLPPPFDYAMQAAFWQAMMNELTNHITNFAGFFAWDGGANGFNSPYRGINYWGMGGTPSAATVNSAYGALLGTTPTITAPTGLSTTSVTQTSISVRWNAVSGTGISYVVQWSLDGANTWNSLPSTTGTTATISGLATGTTYDIRVYTVQGAQSSAPSAAITATTSSTVTKAIVLNSPGSVPHGSPFGVTGTLTGYTSIPTLSYVDDPSLSAVPNITESETTNSITLSWGSVTGPIEFPLPNGSTVTLTTFAFSHPAITTTGSHTLTVTDGTLTASVTYTVT